MCNNYRIKPKRVAIKDLHEKVSAAAANLDCSLVRKSDSGVVVTADLGVEVMRWGFHRSFNPSVNNARSDKLAGSMWAEAYRDRRCVIPMTLFYEWGAGDGRKQAYEFADPNGEFLWVAGIWEEHPEFGRCYSMVTTSAPPLMAPIHDRMPAILPPADARAYLSGKSWTFTPFDQPLIVTSCGSPLVKPQGPDPQQELF
jgi:putative SOS response-associated peptidase YedK